MHKVCMAMWANAKRASGSVPCPFCRKSWSPPGIPKPPAAAAAVAPPRAPGASMAASAMVIGEEGYYNLAGVMGLNPKRDAST